MDYSFNLAEISSKLANASQLEKKMFDVSPSGYGIHWYVLDEDISIDGLLGNRHKPDFTTNQRREFSHI
jgi:hypothetical protein